MRLDGSALLDGRGTVECSSDGWRGRREVHTGVWELFHSERAPRIERFLREYGYVRQAEGRGATGIDAVRRLPWANPNDPVAAQWAVRARSFAHLHRRVLRGLPTGTRILDLGAGNGWLSRRLAVAGHSPVAVDLFADAEDGLAAATRAAVPLRFPCVRADFDSLPLAGAVVDLVIFNASLHYSADLRASLAEALRVLASGGRIVVLDSPCYQRAESGDRMVAERRKAYRAQHGFESDALGSREFFVPAELRRIGEDLGVGWTSSRPWLGAHMAWRPIRARLQGRRPPASFPLWVGRRVV